MTEICFGSTKMGNFYREKAFHVGKKLRKNDFAPSENMPVTPLELGHSLHPIIYDALEQKVP